MGLRARRLVRATAVFFFNDTATTEIYTLSLHDALPISIAHLGVAWIGEDTAVSQRAGPELHPAPVPRDHPTVADEAGGGRARPRGRCGLLPANPIAVVGEHRGHPPPRIPPAPARGPEPPLSD